MSFLLVRSKDCQASPYTDDLLKKWFIVPPQEDVVCPSGVVPISSLQSLKTEPAYIPTMVRTGGVGNIVLHSSGQSRAESRAAGIPSMRARAVTPPVKSFVPTVQGVSGFNHSREQAQAAASLGVSSLSRTEESRAPFSPLQRDFFRSLGVLDSSRDGSLSDEEIYRRFSM